MAQATEIVAPPSVPGQPGVGMTLVTPKAPVNEIGVMSAVDAARKAVFFVELMRGDALRARAAVNLPAVTQALLMASNGLALLAVSAGSGGFHIDFDRDEGHCRRQISRILHMVPASSISDDPEHPLRKRWAELQKRAEKPEQGAAYPTVDELDDLVTGFIHAARPRLIRAYEDLLSQIYRHLATLTALIVSAAILLAVPQMRTLMLERLWYVAAALIVILPAPIAGLVGLWYRRPSWRGRAPALVCFVGTSFFWRWAARYPKGYDVVASNSRIGTQIAAATLLKAGAFVAWLTFCALVLRAFDEHRILQTVGWTVCLMAAKLTLGALLDLWDFVHPAPVRGIFLILILFFWGIYAWWDFSSFTLVIGISVGFVTLLALLVLVARATSAVPRGWASLVGIACVAWVGATASLYLEDATESEEAWGAPRAGPPAAPLVHLSEEDWPHRAPGEAVGPPVIVMAASGGGSRAAVLTALTLEQLEKTTASCDGEQLSNHLQAISSVSGGSLATAAYVAARLKGEGAAGLSGAVADDFLQPVLLGAIWPSVSRGRSLENYWAKQLSLGRTFSEVAARWRSGLKEKRPPLPVPLFNSATLDAHSVVISPLSWQAFMDESERSASDGKSYYPDEADPAEGEPTWVFYRSSVYSLEQFLPKFNPNFAQAVRASANFPFGFPVVQVETESRLAFSPRWEDRALGKKERVRLTDGGVVSNSGMWTLFRVLKRAAETKDLKRRGVVLVMVDATKMPEYAGRTRVRDLLNSILDQSPIAGNLHGTMLDVLQRALGHRLAVLHVAFKPTVNHNVYTSWALDADSRKNIESTARPVLDEMSQQASKVWCDLKDPKATIDRPITRLPID